MTLRNGQSLVAAARPSGGSGRDACLASKLARLALPVPAPRLTQPAPAFTLIELILVMAILIMMVSVTAPTLSRFFRGRTLNSEARRLLALTRSGQSRAVSEGLPMDLWVDAERGAFGLQAEPSYDPGDPKAVDFTLDGGLRLEVVRKPVTAATPTMNTMNLGQQPSIASVPRVILVHAGLPTIRFLPDGSTSETSPQELRLTDRDGASLWVRQSRDGVNYEISSTAK